MKNNQLFSKKGAIMVNLLSSDWLPPANMMFKQQAITATVSNRWMVGWTDTQMDAWMIA